MSLVRQEHLSSGAGRRDVGGTEVAPRAVHQNIARHDPVHRMLGYFAATMHIARAWCRSAEARSRRTLGPFGFWGFLPKPDRVVRRCATSTYRVDDGAGSYFTSTVTVRPSS